MPDGVIIPGCGHVYCRDCLVSSMVDPDSPKSCPTCRGPVTLGSLIAVDAFLDHFAPSKPDKEEVELPAMDDKGKDPETLLEGGDPNWKMSSKMTQMMALLDETRANSPLEKTISMSRTAALWDHGRVLSSFAHNIFSLFAVHWHVGPL